MGVIVYILLTGRPAFHGADYKQILAKNKQGNPPYPSRFWKRISEDGQRFVKKLIENDQDVRLSAIQALDEPWFTHEEGANEDLLKDDEVRDGFKEIQEFEIDPKSNTSDVSNPLLTVTPVMAGRKLKDTCESPWNPSGMTPKIQDATPMLKHGFSDNRPKRAMNFPGLPAVGATPAEEVEEVKKVVPLKNAAFPEFDKLDELNKKRKNRQGTTNFASIAGIKQPNEEEAKINPVTNLPIVPLKLEKPPSEISNEKNSILNKILESNSQNKTKSPVLPSKSDPIPDNESEKPVEELQVNKVEEPTRPAITDSEVNISDDLL